MTALLEGLRREHRLIEEVAGALVAFAAQPTRADADLAAFCTFFGSYVDEHHHGKEEGVLFPALRARELPERGPLAMLRTEHEDNRRAITELRAGGASDPALAGRARRFCARLWEHIDKEDSVLFEEAEVRLVLERQEIERQLAAHDEEHAARAAELVLLGQELVKRFPPDPGFAATIFRGEGCSACRHFGDGCDGIEREWWTDAEWEGFRSRDF